MNKIKIKYEFILGFVSLIISLSVFKDELSAIPLTILSWKISLYGFFKIMAALFMVSLYINLVQQLLSDSGLTSVIFLDGMHLTGSFIFICVVASPIILLVIMLLSSLATVIINYYNDPILRPWLASLIIHIVEVIVGVITVIAIAKQVNEDNKTRKESEITNINLKIISLKSSSADAFLKNEYSLSFILNVQALSYIIYKALKGKGVDSNPQNLMELIDKAYKSKLITEENEKELKHFQKIMNQINHTNLVLAEEELTKYLQQIHKIDQKLEWNR